MKFDIDKVFDRLLQLTNAATLRELSLMFGYKQSWASNTRNKNKIPFDVCLKVAIEKKISIDYLVFGIQNEIGVEKNIIEVNKAVVNGVFNAIEYQQIKRINEINITEIANTIVSQIRVNKFLDE
jgi:hypothetical protein